MKNKKVIVTLKYYKGELNPFDGAALEAALELGFGDITAVSMAPQSVMSQIEALTRLGIKAILISDAAYAGSDTQATSYVLSEVIKRENPDLIFCGRQSIDGDTAQVPPMLAERLGYRLVNKVVDFDKAGNLITRTGEKESFKGRDIITFERIRTLRFPSMFSKPGTVRLITNSDLNLDKDKVGLSGSPTRVIKSYESTLGRRQCKFIDKEDFLKVISDSLAMDRLENYESSGEKLPEIFYFGNLRELAESISDRAVEIAYKGRAVQEIKDELVRLGAGAVIFEGTDELKLLSAKLAVMTGAGLCADCISFRVENGKIVMTRPAGGGNVTADIISTSDMAFATVKKAFDGTGDVIFSVGKGAASFIDKIKNIASKYSAEICCSRIVADSGKLSYSSQVGLTGKVVSPKVYVAFGISGAVQHTVGMCGAQTVIAINKDKNAQIFDYADYGIIADINDFKGE